MSELTIRKLPFVFDETIPFLWQPNNPSFSMMANGVSFLAVGFEKYIVAVMRDAEAIIADPAIKVEADLFLRQEALHARAHRHHVAALVGRYPGLADVLAATEARYDTLRASLPLEYHLAYIADVEATFTSIMSMMLDNRTVLFDGGDDRVASLFLWHFVEEMEHRSSALAVFRSAVGREWYRVRVMPSVLRHSHQTFTQVTLGFDRHVPVEDRLISAAEVFDSNRSRARDLWDRRPLFKSKSVQRTPGPLDAIPWSQSAKAMLKMTLAEMPYHDPAKEKLPAFASEWHDAYERGLDVTRWYGSASATT